MNIRLQRNLYSVSYFYDSQIWTFYWVADKDPSGMKVPPCLNKCQNLRSLWVAVQDQIVFTRILYFWLSFDLYQYLFAIMNLQKTLCKLLVRPYGIIHWSLFMSQENTFHKIAFFTFLHKFSRRGAFVGHTDDECILHSFVSNWKLLYT